MTPLPSYYSMTVKELYQRIRDLYPGIDSRPLVISVPPNSYRKADYIYIDHHGSPPKGGAIYDKARRHLYLLSVGLDRKYRVGSNVQLPELDALEVGFYLWTIEDSVTPYREAEV
ncbi:MAG: hypothetical protein ABIJ47_06835 [Candidatus Bathyarchaeota archaeon]